MTVRFPDTLLVPYVAVTDTTVAVLSGVVVTVKVALVWPAATVTLAGVVAAVLLSCNLTSAPPGGAGPLSIKVPVELFPPVTGLGLKVTADTRRGLTVRAADIVLA